MLFTDGDKVKIELEAYVLNFYPGSNAPSYPQYYWKDNWNNKHAIPLDLIGHAVGLTITKIKPRLDELPVGTIVRLQDDEGIFSQYCAVVRKDGIEWIAEKSLNSCWNFESVNNIYNDYITIWSPND